MPKDTSLHALRAFDTPTLCNALEELRPERRGSGFTTGPLLCVHPKLPPILAQARTATIRAASAPERDAAAERKAALEYYRYVGAPPHPTITVIQDLDDPPGQGAWWGEVHTHVHRALGSLGVITDGSVRDLDAVDPHFQVLAAQVVPSHMWVRPVDVGIPVTVAGLRVEPGDWIHADRHGALVIPADAIDALPAAAEAVVARERVLIDASRRDGFDVERLERLLGGSGH